MKKYIAILLCLSVLLICLVACDNKNDNGDPTDSVNATESNTDNDSETIEEDEPDLTEPNFGDESDTDDKIQINGDTIGTPGGSNAGENWTNPY